MTKKGTEKKWADEVFERTGLSSAEEVVSANNRSHINIIMTAVRTNYPLAADFIGSVVQAAANNGNFHEERLLEDTKRHKETTGQYRRLITGDGADLVAYLYRQCDWQLHLSMSGLKVQKVPEVAVA